MTHTIASAIVIRKKPTKLTIYKPSHVEENLAKMTICCRIGLLENTFIAMKIAMIHAMDIARHEGNTRLHIRLAYLAFSSSVHF